MIRRRMSLALVPAALVLSLAACSSTPEQTQEEACAVVEDAFADIQQEFNDATFSVDDPANIADALEASAGRLQNSEGDIHNAEVRSAVSDFREDLQEFARITRDVDTTGTEPPAELMTAWDSVMESATALGRVCPV